MPPRYLTSSSRSCSLSVISSTFSTCSPPTTSTSNSAAHLVQLALATTLLPLPFLFYILFYLLNPLCPHASAYWHHLQAHLFSPHVRVGTCRHRAEPALGEAVRPISLTPSCNQSNHTLIVKLITFNPPNAIDLVHTLLVHPISFTPSTTLLHSTHPCFTAVDQR